MLPITPSFCSVFFFFNDTATTEIYTLSLHDALPISGARGAGVRVRVPARRRHPRRAVDVLRREVRPLEAARLLTPFMLIGADHRRWIVGTVITALLALAAYLVYVHRALHGPSGGSWPGLILGAAGLALMLYAGLLGGRRKGPTWRIGRAPTWMKRQLWLGLLSYVLVPFPRGFPGGGPLTVTLTG